MKYFRRYFNNMRKTGLNSLYDFSVDNRALDISDTTNIHKYLIKKYDIKYCLGLLKIYLLYD